MVKKGFILTMLEIILSFVLIVSFMIPVTLFMYVNVNNEVFYNIDLLIKDETDAGRISPLVYAEVENTLDLVPIALNKIDFLFLACLITMTTILLFSAYFAKRMSIFETLFAISWGIIFILLIIGIVFLAGNWVNDIVMSMIEGIGLTMPVYTWYLANGVYFHFGLFLVCVFLNYVDLNLLKDEKRKEREVFNDELG